MGATVSLPIVGVSIDDQQTFKSVLVPMLRAQLGEDVYSSWFARLQLETIAGEIARFTVPTRFLKSWIDSHYHTKLTALVEQAFPVVKRPVIGIRTGIAPATTARPPLAVVASQERAVSSNAKPVETPRLVAAEIVTDEALVGSPIDPRLTLDSFHAGKSNQLAHAAAQRIGTTAAGEPPIYNPLYIHSAVGLGKTHLLQAVANAAKERQRRVLYMTAEKFMYGFAVSLRLMSLLDYKKRLRDIDMLVIDDVQFLQGKQAQQEFSHAVNALLEERRQVVIAADRPPHDLESLQDRLRSRLGGGLCVEIDRLDLDLRIRILESRIAAARARMPGFELAPDVIAHVATLIQTNGRDLEGAVNRLMAHSSLTQSEPNAEQAEAAISDLIRAREPKRIKIEDIQNLVARHYNVSRAEIMSARRTSNVVRPRQIAMYLSKVMTLRSLPEIGRRFGGRDHTTVLHAVRKMEKLKDENRELGAELKTLQAMLEDR